MTDHATLPSSQMPDDYPATHAATTAGAKKSQVSLAWAVVALAVVLTLLVALVGVLVAWRDARGDADAFQEQLNCPRQAAADLDIAVSDGIDLLVTLDVGLNDALVGLGAEDADRYQRGLKSIEDAILTAPLIKTAIADASDARDESVELCAGSGSTDSSELGG